jgi:hypothetical protein
MVGSPLKLGVPRASTQFLRLGGVSQLHTLLEDVMATKFFSLFKVDLTKECKFWGKEGGGSCGSGKKDDKPAFMSAGGGGGFGGGSSSSSSFKLPKSPKKKPKGADDDEAVPSCALSTGGDNLMDTNIVDTRLVSSLPARLARQFKRCCARMCWHFVHAEACAPYISHNAPLTLCAPV